jgi:hypothetical protein
VRPSTHHNSRDHRSPHGDGNPRLSSRATLGRCVQIIVLATLTALAAAQNPVPQIVGPVKPQAVAPGSGPFTLTVYGANFVLGAVVNWNYQPRTTTFVSARELQAQILSADVATNTAGVISVTNPAPGGGNSSGSFTQLEVHAPTATIVPGQPWVIPSITGFGAGQTIIADFKGNGIPDVASDWLVEMGNGNGTFYRSSYLANARIYSGLTFGDFNGDGKLDIAYVQGDSTDSKGRHIFIMLGDGTGKFKLGSQIDDFGGFSSLATGDFNGDGKLDIAAIKDGAWAVYLGNGDGTFQQLVQYGLRVGGGVSGYYITAGDFNGDGKLDVLVASFNGDNTTYVSIFSGKGDGTFKYPPRQIWAGNGTVGFVNDYNGDGKLDLSMLTGSLQDQIQVLLGNGDGTFTALPPMTVPNAPYSFTAGDFNSDGITDLIVSGTQFSISLGNGDGTFQPQQVITLPGNAFGDNGMIPGDFNSDGLLDFISVDAGFQGVVYPQQ